MCVLMLRGPQTPGELRGNAARLHEFAGLDEIEQTLNALISRDADPLVVRLPRQAGQKEVRLRSCCRAKYQVEADEPHRVYRRARRSNRKWKSWQRKLKVCASSLTSSRNSLE